MTEVQKRQHLGQVHLWSDWQKRVASIHLLPEKSAARCLQVAAGDMEAAQRLSEVESPWKAGTGCKPSSHAVDSEVSSCSYGSADSAWSSPLTQDLHQDNAQGTAELAARGKHSASWERALGVGVGLLNTGNSCYLNAALQCLTHTPPLANYMLSREHSQSCCHHPGSCTMCALEAQVNQSLLHSKDVMQPSKILTGAFHRQKQEDAHEFLMFTLNAMHEACLRGRKPSEESSKDSTPIYEIFGGSWRSQVRCLQCQGTSDAFSPFLDVLLDIHEAHSVKQALEYLVKAEELCGENAYFCDHCQEKTPALKSLAIQGASKVLLLVLNRSSDSAGGKTDRKVRYPESLDLRPYMSQSNRGPLVYALYAVLVHAGATCHSGHYFCYVRAGNGKWYKMDDSTVTRCEVASVLSESAYLLFYVQGTDGRGDSVNRPVGTGNKAHAGKGWQKKHKRRSCVQATEPCREREEAAAQAKSLDQWKVLEENKRPESGLNLQRPGSTPPADGVGIHRARSREDWDRNRPDKENHPWHDSARFPPAPRAMDSGLPCSQEERARSKKKKKKPTWRPLPLY
ncbi:ubiquitin carboxyl-terminal hydrolase 17-like protein B isoform X2 [Cricetulus griseus]|uniref:Ubiquitin carboxyl-terminal hydrolase n=1 Tax=Cricetulus griseus TaxID=10029 RepID=A0A9J7K1X2_CRIGR|nr:ubiquitin carboxyl-terminal hydrolase 17-like protein B isoform X2 [Cricetulus griseus]